MTYRNFGFLPSQGFHRKWWAGLGADEDVCRPQENLDQNRFFAAGAGGDQADSHLQIIGDKIQILARLIR